MSTWIMTVVIGLGHLLGSCVAYKLHNWRVLKAYTATGTKNLKKLLYGSLSLMAISLFGISGDIHYSKSSTIGGQPTQLLWWQQYQKQQQQEEEEVDEVSTLFELSLRKRAAAVALFCIFMVIYSASVRPTVAALEDRLVGQRTSGEATVLYKAISTTTHWLAVPLLIHLFLSNWRYIGFGWILVVFAAVCLLAITFIAVFIPDSVPLVMDEDSPDNNNTTEVVLENDNGG